MQARFESVICIVLLGSLSSCGASAVKPVVTSTPSIARHGSLSIDSLKRTYRLYVPRSLDPKQAAPVVFVLTGCPGTGDEMADLTQLDVTAKAARFIAVYPDPVPDATTDPSNLEGCWNAGTCCGDAQSNRVDDVKFISNLLDQLASDSRVDRGRVFVAGLSGGGMMAYRLACELSNRIAATASVSGAQVIQGCRPARAVSILEMHGTDDSRLPYDGNQYFPSTTSTVQRWVALAGCSSKPTQTSSGITKTSTWSRCRGGAVVRFDTIEGGHHAWFGSDMDPVPGEPSANAVVWDFFRNVVARS